MGAKYADRLDFAPAWPIVLPQRVERLQFVRRSP
jgi:hypothetical protein